MVKWTVILLSISAMAKAVCDKLRFNPADFPFQSDWWSERGENAWNNRTFLEKYFFSFISGGWHLFDAIRIVALLLIVSLLLVKTEEDKIDNNQWFAVLLLVLFGYIIHGSVFEIIYNLL